MSCGGHCAACSGSCRSESGPKEERASCRTCPNRVRCHGKAPDITQETVARVVSDVVVEVIREWTAAGRL